MARPLLLGYRLRRLHRYLGFFLGLQFLAWTIGGLYFSWTNIDEVRGMDIVKLSSSLIPPSGGRSLSEISSSLESCYPPNERMIKAEVVNLLDHYYWLLSFQNDEEKRRMLLDYQSGQVVEATLTDQQVISILSEVLTVPFDMDTLLYLTQTDKHHEYRNKPLPVWAAVLSKPANTTIYVDALTGQVQSVRTRVWRIFDWLWMLHTMDYESRDDFNNSLLRLFSLLGLATIASGYILFFTSLKKNRK